MRQIKLTGRVIIKQDDVILVDKYNDILSNGYKWFCSMWLCSSIASVNIGQKLFVIYLGKGDSANTFSTSALSSQITLTPSMQTGTGVQGTGSHYESRFTSTWLSGLVNAQLTGEEQIKEVGLFFGMCNTQTTQWTSVTWAQGLFSRVVLGENSFVPDASKPLTIDWTIGVDFV